MIVNHPCIELSTGLILPRSMARLIRKVRLAPSAVSAAWLSHAIWVLISHKPAKSLRATTRQLRPRHRRMAFMAAASSDARAISSKNSFLGARHYFGAAAILDNSEYHYYVLTLGGANVDFQRSPLAIVSAPKEGCQLSMGQSGCKFSADLMIVPVQHRHIWANRSKYLLPRALIVRCYPIKIKPPDFIRWIDRCMRQPSESDATVRPINRPSHKPTAPPLK